MSRIPVQRYIIRWFVLLTALLLAVFSIALYSGVSSSAHDGLHASLQARADALQSLCELGTEAGTLEIPDSIERFAEELPSAFSHAIYSWPDGDELLATGVADQLRLPRAEDFGKTVTQTVGRQSFCVLARLWQPEDDEQTPTFALLVARDLRPVDEDMQAMIGWLIAAAGITLAVSFAAARFLAGRIVRPIRRLSEAAAAVQAGRDLSLPDPGSLEEIACLTDVVDHAFERLQSAHDRQARFAANASHELRTPTATVMSTAEVALRRDRDGESYQRALREVLRASERMHDILEGLLLLTRVGAGTLEIELRPVDLAELVTDAVGDLRHRASAKDLHFECRTTSATVSGDHRLLRVLVDNLLTNAIRHSGPDGHVALSIEDLGDQLELRVGDNGAGIPAGSLEHLFEPFYRVDATRARDAGGAGLGLAIVQAIAQAHATTCTATSEAGRGSQFSLALRKA